MNFGMPAFSTGQELLCLEKYYDRYKPNLIILMLFEANDFSDNTAMMMIGRYVPHFVIKDGNIVLKKEPSPLQRFLTFLRDHSFTFYCLQTLAERWNIYTTHELGEDETALMAKILTKMHAYAQSKGTPLLIFYIGQNPLMTQQRAAVEQLCTQSGIFYREIPYLPSERRGGMGHFNEKGHEVIDGIIYDGLLHSGVLGEFTGGGSAAP